MHEPWRGLDIGCGHGVVRSQLESATRWATDGADLKRDALLRNRAAGGETLYYDIHDRDPGLRERYDFLLLFDVIEHVEDPVAFLRSAHFHLKPGGFLFINVPAHDGLRSAFDDAVGHLRRYDRRSLRETVERAGLVVRDLRYWGMSMLPYLVIRRFLPRGGSSVRSVIERGTRAPSAWMERGIGWIMRAETAVLSRAPLGTSLLAAALKPAGPEPAR